MVKAWFLTDIPDMESSTVAERIKARLDALGKNASAVALEAGLSRSSVLDILKGKAANPRLDTLQKLTGPLECSLEYLTGATAEPGKAAGSPLTPAEYALLDGVVVTDGLELVSGVYREHGVSAQTPVPPTLVYRDPIHPEVAVALAVVRDEQLAGIGIRPGDQITYAYEGFDTLDLPLTQGAVVIIRREIGDGPAIEYTARQVQIADGVVRLVAHPAVGVSKPITVTEFAVERESRFLRNYYKTDTGATIGIEGIAVRITRVLPADW